MSNDAEAAPPTPEHLRQPGLFKRILYWILDLDDEATIEEGRRRLRNAPGFFVSLTPEQLEYLTTHEGPDYLGPPITKRNRHLLLHPERHEILSGIRGNNLARGFVP